MTYSVHQGLLRDAGFCASPNCDARPEGMSVDLLVIHCISLPPGQYGGNEIEAFFTNQLDINAHAYFAEICHLQVSSHVLIRRCGGVLQFDNFNDRAWHAGESIFEGRPRCNDFSIGIELEGTDSTTFTDAQYRGLVEVTTAIQRAYPAITDSRITGHAQIAPGRKTDPGSGFDWKHYRTTLKQANIFPQDTL